MEATETCPRCGAPLREDGYQTFPDGCWTVDECTGCGARLRRLRPGDAWEPE